MGLSEISQVITGAILELMLFAVEEVGFDDGGEELKRKYNIYKSLQEGLSSLTKHMKACSSPSTEL
jgi:hypothetical protein